MASSVGNRLRSAGARDDDDAPSVAEHGSRSPRPLDALRDFLRGGMDADIRRVLGHIVRPQDRVLEITASPRCYVGQLAAARTETIFVAPADTTAAIDDLRARLKALEKSRFDVVFLQGIISYARDVQGILAAVSPLLGPDTRLVLLSYNAFWQPLLRLASSLRVRHSTPDENWLSAQDLSNLFLLADLDLVSFRRRVLLPPAVPGLSRLANRFLSSLPGATWLGLCDWYVARARSPERAAGKVSVVVPARNEAGNIHRILDEMPAMGTGVEVLFVEGGSTDGTWETIEREAAAYKGHAQVRAMRQTGKGKKDAAFLGFSEAKGDYLMILDADVTVPPAELPKFYDAMRKGSGEFVNGTRLVYPMEEKAMRFLNLLANRFFAAAFSYILGQPLKDTLCGTKALSRRNWERLNELRKELGERDPFGDFDLLFGASRLQLKIVEVPIRYQARTYGETNISRWRQGWMLLKMCRWGLESLKFI